MPSPDPLRAYLKELQKKYAGGVATEHTHRPALQRLITGRKLSFGDLLHYQQVVVALKETIRLMDEIDRAIPAWPIE
jgi:hypothetical protein